jgi:hypothetical protein
MRKSITILWFTLGVSALVSAAGGCSRQRAVHSSVSATVAGRDTGDHKYRAMTNLLTSIPRRAGIV